MLDMGFFSSKLKVSAPDTYPGVPSRIRIGYCVYHIRIHTQPSNTDTDIGGCEKMISVSAKIGYESDMNRILADRMQILIRYVKNGYVKG